MSYSRAVFRARRSWRSLKRFVREKSEINIDVRVRENCNEGYGCENLNCLQRVYIDEIIK